MLAAGLALVGAGHAGADTTITVDCAADATALATALASPGLIDGTTLAITGTCTGNFEITRSLTLDGSGGAALDAHGVGTVLTVDAGQTVDVTHLTITGGHGSSARGFLAVGGIENFGTLGLTHSSVNGNSADGVFFPVGGVDNEGTLTLTHSSVNGNSASGPLAEGGINNCALAEACTLTLTRSTVNENSATSLSRNARGGITNQTGGTVTLSQSSITGNVASAPAAAEGSILNFGSALTLTNSTVNGNSASGAAAFGGIRNGVDTPLRITNSTVNENSASGGFAVGGVANDGPFTLTNSSVSGNSASTAAAFPRAATGGIATGTDSLTVVNSTVSVNEANAASIAAGGIARFSGTVTLRNSTVVNNTLPNCDFSDLACA